MLKIDKQEIELDYGLKKKLEIIFSFVVITPTIIKGSVVSIEKTNLAYVEPHSTIINNTKILFFNNSTDIYINNLQQRLKSTN
jgi:hypothetical protein